MVLRPLKAGYFNFTSASVSYLAQEGGQVVVSAVSSPCLGLEDAKAFHQNLTTVSVSVC